MSQNASKLTVNDSISESLCFCESEEQSIKEPAPSPPKFPDRGLSRSDLARFYIEERRIEELMNFFVCKLLAHTPKDPFSFLIQLIDDCMLFRAGVGQPPHLFEPRHVKQMMKSFDPGNRGWMTAEQVCRARATVGLPTTCEGTCFKDDVTVTEDIERSINEELTVNLCDLLSAGMPEECECCPTADCMKEVIPQAEPPKSK